jgi:hypothetical protein
MSSQVSSLLRTTRTFQISYEKRANLLSPQIIGKPLSSTYVQFSSIAMCALAANENESTRSWVTADSWESDLEIFVGSLDVALDIDKTIHKQIPHHRFQVMYLCGNALRYY